MFEPLYFHRLPGRRKYFTEIDNNNNVKEFLPTPLQVISTRSQPLSNYHLAAFKASVASGCQSGCQSTGGCNSAITPGFLLVKPVLG